MSVGLGGWGPDSRPVTCDCSRPKGDARLAARDLGCTKQPADEALKRRDVDSTQFARLRLAYETLSDPERRAVYDAKLLEASQPQQSQPISASTSAHTAGRSVLGRGRIVMKREVYSHNHPISDVDADAGTSSVYNYIRENANHRVTMDDVRNLLSDDDAVVEMFVNFNLESPLNVSSVHENAHGEAGVISFTSGHVRAMLDRFPEVIQMDCTHQTNQYNYQLLTMRLAHGEVHRRAQQAFGRISRELAQVPDEVFESAMSDLDKWWYNLRHGKTDLLPPPSSGDDGSGSGGGGGNDGGAPGGSASQGEDPQEDHHDDNAEEGNMQDEDGSDDEAPTQVVHAG
ncbi:hypothetical protein PHYSODRAFT_324450 [Phytophthora sojae]|uniref:ZSWIM1/3 RNaseH-like domain-containing protein n=1 Tax=Phytophthora sojae (strain P6497) TaxID=1094619 RepID=G4YY71_PHYSP|nr:hypothetical protein PHYSODRAFT_324450 [Phytophthora sojae]EGZ23222.1 hypothetical protein PHYSODRAFT_324450 [Phytophthora sojae]|eukprot:XP_009518510.1 hypothetical protein PHYSODRAFT_324450 [Phytophthora sojae]